MQNTYQFSTNNTCLIFEERLYKQNLTIFELQFYFHKAVNLNINDVSQ